MVTQCDNTGAGQGGNIDNHVRVKLLHVGQCIAEDEPALGVGIQHFDSLPAHAGYHVAGFAGVAVRQVFRCRHHADQVNGQAEFGDG